MGMGDAPAATGARYALKRSMPIQPPQTESSAENHERDEHRPGALVRMARLSLRGSPKKARYQRRNM